MSGEKNLADIQENLIRILKGVPSRMTYFVSGKANQEKNNKTKPNSILPEADETCVRSVAYH
jgi:hypothetical protein